MFEGSRFVEIVEGRSSRGEEGNKWWLEKEGGGNCLLGERNRNMEDTNWEGELEGVGNRCIGIWSIWRKCHGLIRRVCCLRLSCVSCISTVEGIHFV